MKSPNDRNGSIELNCGQEITVTLILQIRLVAAEICGPSPLNESAAIA